jgi:MFS family permease
MDRAVRNIRLLAWFNFCNDFRIYGPVMVVYFAQVTGSYADAVLLLAIAKVSSSLFEVPTGVFSDRVGRRLTMLAGQLTNIACIGAYAVGDSFAVLAIGALLEGLSFALFSGNQEAFLYDTLKDDGAEQSFPEYQGQLSSMFQIALALSALTATVVLLWSGFRTLFWLSLIPQAIGLVIGYFTVEPSRHESAIQTNLLAHLRDAVIGFRHDARLRGVSIASIIGFALGEAKHMFYPAYFATLWSPSGLGVASTLTHAFAALGFRAAGRIIRRWRELPVLLWANAASILFGVAATATPTVASPAIASLAAMPYGPSVVAQGSLMQQGFSDRQRATMGSLVSLAGNLLYAVVVFALGWFADRVGPRYALLVAEVATISVMLLYWRLFGREVRGRDRSDC